jgi:beta-1,2-mannobiose phosphorylase / 1,2-beta-oligomannan phosphorylase
MRPILFSVLFAVISLALNAQQHQERMMMFGDTSRIGRPFTKDPHVVKFNGSYLMYYTIPAHKDKNHPVKGLGIGIAESKNMIDWKKIGEITPETEPEKNGLAAPCAIVINRQVHLFYQTYGNGPKDAICHAVSDDGMTFRRNPTNPIFRPTGDWNCGRAIDAEVFPFGDRYLLFFATRDSAYKIQMQGVAAAPRNTNFNRDQWTQLTDAPILKPQYPWEGQCVEGASIVEQNGMLYMFYAGAYNNNPQQIGVAKSSDGVKWERLSNKPFLVNGDPGSWNYSESGHPHLFRDDDGKTYLFYQGNNDNGKTWYISKVEVGWNEKGPYLKK